MREKPDAPNEVHGRLEPELERLPDQALHRQPQDTNRFYPRLQLRPVPYPEEELLVSG